MIHQSPVATQTAASISILCTGDVILDVPRPRYWLAGIAPALGIAYCGAGPDLHPARQPAVVTPYERQRRKQRFGVEPDPAYTLAPFHPDAVNAFMARLARSAERIRGCRYLTDITRAACLPALSLQTIDGRISA